MADAFCSSLRAEIFAGGQDDEGEEDENDNPGSPKSVPLLPSSLSNTGLLVVVTHAADRLGKRVLDPAPGFSLDLVGNTVESCRMMLPDLYWLCRCEGWQVLSPDRRVGRVVRILFGSSPNMPDAFAVRTGLFRAKELILPATEVATVDRERRRLILHSNAAWSEFPAILEARRAPTEEGIAAS